MNFKGIGDTLFIDKVFVKINGKQHYLWRAVDQYGEVVDVRQCSAIRRQYFINEK